MKSEGKMFKWDATITLGSLLTAVAVTASILGSAYGFYSRVDILEKNQTVIGTNVKTISDNQTAMTIDIATIKTHQENDAARDARIERLENRLDELSKELRR